MSDITEQQLGAIESLIEQADQLSIGLDATGAPQLAQAARNVHLPTNIARAICRELRSHRQHKGATCVDWQPDTKDLRRLVALFMHDMARPSSTNGELSLAAALTWAIGEIERLRDGGRRG